MPLGASLASYLTITAVHVVLPNGANAATYQACIKWSIDTDDSEVGINGGPNDGGIEDHYLGCNGGCDVIARGVRIKVSRSGFSTTLDTNPSTGCASWSDAGGSGLYDITVYGYATDSHGTFVRVHTATSEACDQYPGDTHSALIEDAQLTAGGSNQYTVPYASKWTAMAAAAFTLYRTGLISNKGIHIELEPSWCTTSTAHYQDTNSHITSGVHCLHFGDTCTPPSTPATRRKFVVAHEMGHAILALAYGESAGAVDGPEPPTPANFNNTPSAANHCGSAGNDSYSVNSKEYNSLAFREGWGHFISAVVWNSKAAEGAFNWWGGLVVDLERYGPSTFGNGDNISGGRLENFCCDPSVDGSCVSSWANQGTIEDWLRFLWDLYTTPNNYCAGGAQASLAQMVDIYAETRRNGDLSATNYAMKMAAAAADDDIALPACLITAFEDLQVHNGADH